MERDQLSSKLAKTEEELKTVKQKARRAALKGRDTARRAEEADELRAELLQIRTASQGTIPREEMAALQNQLNRVTEERDSLLERLSQLAAQIAESESRHQVSSTSRPAERALVATMALAQAAIAPSAQPAHSSVATGLDDRTTSSEAPPHRADAAVPPSNRGSELRLQAELGVSRAKVARLERQLDARCSEVQELRDRITLLRSRGTGSGSTAVGEGSRNHAASQIATQAGSDPRDPAATDNKGVRSAAGRSIAQDDTAEPI